MKQAVKRLVVPFQLKASEDPASHTFEGLAAVIGQKDLGNDIIEPGAFKNTLGTWLKSGEALPLLNSHDQFNIMSALGQLISAKEQKDGLWTQWEVIDGPEGEAVMKRLTPSKITGRAIVGKMSIGYIPVKWEIEQPEGTSSYFDQIRHLTEVELKECSLVLFPMAPGASIDASSVKSFLLSAQATEAKSLDVAAKTELRKLATRIGILLKKQDDPTASAAKDAEDDESAEKAKAKKPKVPDASESYTPGKEDPEHPDNDLEGDDDDLDVVADLSKDSALDDDADEGEGDDDHEDGIDSPTPKKKKEKSDDPIDEEIKKTSAYVYQEALAHRLQKTMLKNKVSSIGASDSQ